MISTRRAKRQPTTAMPRRAPGVLLAALMLWAGQPADGRTGGNLNHASPGTGNPRPPTTVQAPPGGWTRVGDPSTPKQDQRDTHARVTFTVFDCLDPHSAMDTLSLEKPEECRIAVSMYQKPRNVSIQVIQTDVDSKFPVMWCLVRVTRKVTYCGDLHQAFGGQHTADFQRVLTPDPADCRRTYAAGVYKYKGLWEVNLKSDKGHHIETTITQSFWTRGTAGNGTCEVRESWKDESGEYFVNSIEETILQVRFAQVQGIRTPHSKLIRFDNPSTVFGYYADGYLQDSMLGTLTWIVKDDEGLCADSLHRVVTGAAQWFPKKNSTLAVPSDDDLLLYYAKDAETGEDSFAGLVVKGRRRLCGHEAYSTQIIDIAVLVGTGDPPAKHEFLSDITVKAHVDIKSTALQAQLAHNHITHRMSLAQMIDTLHSNICELERTVMQNKMQAIASGQSDYALLNTHGPGYLAIRRGAAAYVIRCRPKSAIYRDSENCTQEIPAWVEGKERWADPLTFILQEYPQGVTCDSQMPVRWLIEGQWFCASPGLSAICNPPSEFSVRSHQEDSRHHEYGRGLSSTWYSAKAAQTYRESLMIHGARQAAIGEYTSYQVKHGSDGRLLGPSDKGIIQRMRNDLNETWNHVGDSIKNQVGQALVPFWDHLGTGWSKLVLFLGCCSMLKFVFDAIMRAIALRKQYPDRSWCYCFLGGMWDSVTAYLLLPVRAAQWALNRDNRPPPPPAPRNAGSIERAGLIAATRRRFRQMRRPRPRATSFGRTEGTLVEIPVQSDDGGFAEVPRNGPYRPPAEMVRDLQRAADLDAPPVYTEHASQDMLPRAPSEPQFYSVQMPEPMPMQGHLLNQGGTSRPRM